MFRYGDLQNITDYQFRVQSNPIIEEFACLEHTSPWLRCSANTSEQAAEPFMAELVENEVKDELTLRLRPTPVTSELFISYCIYKEVDAYSDWSAVGLLAMPTSSIVSFCGKEKINLQKKGKQESIEVRLARNKFSGDRWLFKVEFFGKGTLFKLVFSFFTHKKKFVLEATPIEEKNGTVAGMIHFNIISFVLFFLLVFLYSSFSFPSISFLAYSSFSMILHGA